MKKLVQAKNRPGLLLGAALWLGASVAFAAEPCPPGAEASAACTRFKAAQQRLEAARAAQPTRPAEQAQASDSAEARAKAVVDGFIKLLSEIDPELSLKINRDYSLTEDGGAYQVTFAEAALVKDSITIDFHPLALKVQPRDGGLSLINLKIGDAISFQEGETTVGRLLIGQQETTGVWNEALQVFVQSDLSAADLKVVVNDTPVKAGIGSVSLHQAILQEQNGAWSQQTIMNLGDLSVQGEGGGLNLASAAMQFGMDGRDLGKFLSLNRELKALMQKQKPGDTEAMKRLIKRVGDMLDLFSRYDFSLIAGDMTIGGPEQTLATLERTSMSSGFGKTEGGGSQLGYEFEMGGLQVAAPNVPNQLLPTDLRLDLGLVNLPPHLWDKIVEIMTASEQIEDEELKQTYIGQQALALVMSSGVGAYVKNSFVKAPEARLDLNLHSKVDPQAAMSATGEMQMRIEGLDKVIESISAMGDEDSAQSLAALMAFSNRTEENGKTIDSFDLELTKEGKFWLNGKDMSALFAPQEQPEGQPPAQPLPQ